ncbi:hypothetical protein FA13DRAFT_1775480 [Coprinellus micaceus]|uniref:Nephrocystin 3-like N-terminal domain-containing protein n=1 Tax=Coprinellus micaceus TaxID=71717 RepID=A0A4Y7T5Z8_COPMI|nr:hypothetical protein FA13DRAFT_1775480 [Coprinellus micaceus]
MASTPAYHESTLKTSGRDFLDYSTTHISNTFVSTSTNDPFRELLNNTVVAAIHNSSDRCDAPKCHPETRLAVQEHILGWAGYGDKKPPEQQILWVSGPAGAGKTAIMGTIADTLKKDGKLAASFFFSSFSKSKERGVKDHFVTTIVYQLTQHEGLENLKSAILSSVQKDPSIFKKCLREQAEALILKPLRQVALQPGALPEVIIIDGLDECGAIIHDDFKDSERTSAQNLRESDQLEVLSILQDLVKDASCPFRVIVASRPETVIKVSFSCLQPQACSIFLDDKYNPDVDITLFLKAKFAQIRLRYTRISPAWPREADIQQLVRNASGQFIYAATVIRFMETRRSTPQEQLKIVLKTRLTDSSNPLELLDALYGQVVKSSHKPIEALTWLKAYCTLDLAGDFGPTKAWFWCKLCESSEGEADFLLEKLSALLCASDLDAPCEASIVFYHKSFQDFLSDPSRYRAQFPNLSDETAGEWLVQRFKSALRLVAERQPQVRIGDPYFQDVFDAIVPLYWRAIPGHADYRTKRMRTIEGACQMVDKRFAPQDPASDGLLPSDIVILCYGSVREWIEHTCEPRVGMEFRPHGSVA